jgi:hypothetical protein
MVRQVETLEPMQEDTEAINVALGMVEWAGL